MTTAADQTSAELSAHVVADQSEVATFLAKPSAYGAQVASVERIDTHAAMVFLAGRRAYKVKRAVKFPYMDFSTLALRQKACEREIELNRRTAPQLYVAAQPIVRLADGSLSLGGDGDVVDWAVVMERFDQDGLFDRMARAGRLTPDLMLKLTDAIVHFYEAADRLSPDQPEGGGADGLRWVFEENLAEFGERPDLFPAAEVAAMGTAARESLDLVGQLLDRRLEDGFVRRCHGDLHLRNICLIDGQPTLFDCIEFNDNLACIDVLYDLAFLLMDLEHKGLRHLGNLVLNRYFQKCDALKALAALPVFMACRACVRAKVSASAEASQSRADARQRLQEEARFYFSESLAYLDPKPPWLVAVGGLSGTGKSTLARSLAPRLGRAPGAVHLRSDIVRKQLWECDEAVRLPADAYGTGVSAKVYEEMLQRARRALDAGQAVIVDAVFADSGERQAAEAIARDLSVSFKGLWLEAEAETLLGRVGARHGDASDATPEVVRKQLGYDLGVISWKTVDATGAPEQVLDRAARSLFEPDAG